jgi:hypothetical protein
VISASRSLVEDHRGCGNMPQLTNVDAAPAELERQQFEARLRVANHIVRVLREAGLQCELHSRLGQH